MARLALRRWRCWWQQPLGHIDETIDYVDTLSGRWAARIRCASCGREKGLAIGQPRHGSVFPNNPLATMLSRQGSKRSGPPAKKAGLGPPSARPGAIEVVTPDGVRILIRGLNARVALGRPRTVYLALVVGAPHLPAVSGDLRGALAGVDESVEKQWLERTARQLEAELSVGS